MHNVSQDYMVYLIPYISEIIVSDKLTDLQRELQFNAIMQLRGILNHYEKLGYRSDLICKIAEKKGAMILTVTSKSEMLKVLKPDCPHYDGNKFIPGKYNVPEEELICWSEVSLKAGGPLISVACERYISLFKSIFLISPKTLDYFAEKGDSDMSFDLCKEIRGCMTEFQQLTPKLIEKLSCEGLTFEELKAAMDKAGLSIYNVVCDTSRVFQNAFYADYENGKYCEIYLQRSYIDRLLQISMLNFSYEGKNPLLISKNWKQYYFQSVPVPMAIYDFSRRYLEIPQDEVFAVWLSIHKRIDYSYGLWDDRILEYVFSYAPKCDVPPADEDGYITVYRGVGSISQPSVKAISWTSNHMNALWFANHNGVGTAVLTGKVKPDDIITYQSGYSEENEVIVRPGTVSQISKEDFIPATNECAVPLMVPIFEDFARFGMAARKLGYPIEGGFQFHGIKHILRVLTLTLIYCYNSGDNLSEEDKEILIYFSLLHDYGRDSEDVDDEHGQKSIAKIHKNRPGISGIRLSKKAQLIAEYLIKYHCISDELGEKAINTEPKFSSRDKFRTVHLYHIAKDMDGLDRVRFHGLDYKMLRTEFGKKLPLIAGALQHEQLINLLSEHDFEECMQIIAAKQRNKLKKEKS